MNDQLPDCCDISKIQRVKTELPDVAVLNLMSGLFSSLGDNTRLSIVLALSKQEMCVHELAVTVDSTTSAVSHQLRKLKDKSIVDSRREGQVKFYKLTDERIRQMLDLVLDFELTAKTVH